MSTEDDTGHVVAADFTDVTDADFTDAVFADEEWGADRAHTGCRFTDADLRGLRTHRCRFTECDFTGADLGSPGWTREWRCEL